MSTWIQCPRDMAPAVVRAMQAARDLDTQLLRVFRSLIANDRAGAIQALPATDPPMMQILLALGSFQNTTRDGRMHIANALRSLNACVQLWATLRAHEPHPEVELPDVVTCAMTIQAIEKRIHAFQETLPQWERYANDPTFTPRPPEDPNAPGMEVA